MNKAEETAHAKMHYGPDVSLKVMTYQCASGRTFEMLRPTHVADTFVYVGRDVTAEELLAIWDYHAQFA